MTEGPVTRGEFDMLRAVVRENGQRLEAIDASGTRGVSSLAVQVADLIKDVAEIRSESTGVSTRMRPVPAWPRGGG